MTVDVFLLDWERPDAPAKPGVDQPISVWRTYLVGVAVCVSNISNHSLLVTQVANEWNELQTLRKTKISLQVILVIFLMKVVGMENLTTADPESRLWPEEGAYVAETSYVCRSSTLLLTKLLP